MTGILSMQCMSYPKNAPHIDGLMHWRMIQLVSCAIGRQPGWDLWFHPAAKHGSAESGCFAKCSVLFVFSLVTCQEERVISDTECIQSTHGHCKLSLWLNHQNMYFFSYRELCWNGHAPHHVPLVVLASSLELCPGSGGTQGHKDLVNVFFSCPHNHHPVSVSPPNKNMC